MSGNGTNGCATGGELRRYRAPHDNDRALVATANENLEKENARHYSA